jgi:SAM-dependent methyltransferase
LADVGCGVGLTDSMIIDRVAAVSGFDESAESVAVAAETNPSATYFHADGPELPAEADSFDVAFAINVIHHVDPSDRPEFVAELRRIVRPGGLVIVFEHNPFNPLTRLSVLRCEFDKGVELLSRRNLRRLVGEAGLTPVAARYVIFSTSAAPSVLAAERRIGWLPLGAQHVLVSRV